MHVCMAKSLWRCFTLAYHTPKSHTKHPKSESLKSEVSAVIALWNCCDCSHPPFWMLTTRALGVAVSTPPAVMASSFSAIPSDIVSQLNHSSPGGKVWFR